MGKKTVENFFKQLEEDADFRSFVEQVSAKDLALWLSTHGWEEDTWPEITARLWMRFPHKKFGEMLDFMHASSVATDPLPLYPDHTALDQDYLARIIDPDEAVATLKLYNIGTVLDVSIPLSGGRERVIRLERGNAPKVIETREGARLRLAKLLVEAAENQPPKMRARLDF